MSNFRSYEKTPTQKRASTMWSGVLVALSFVGFAVVVVLAVVVFALVKGSQFGN